MREQFYSDAYRLCCIRHQYGIDSSYVVLDSLLLENANSPELNFIKGGYCDLKNDSAKSRLYFLRAYNSYVNRISKYDNFQDKLNHALLTQILYGLPAYYRELDSLSQTTSDTIELSSIGLFRRSLIYEKRILEPEPMLMNQ